VFHASIYVWANAANADPRHVDELVRHVDELGRYVDELDRYVHELFRHVDELDRSVDELVRYVDQLDRSDGDMAYVVVMVMVMMMIMSCMHVITWIEAACAAHATSTPQCDEARCRSTSFATLVSQYEASQ
jgi:hypothetical protein